MTQRLFTGMSQLAARTFGNDADVTIYPNGAGTGTVLAKGVAILRGVPVEGGDELGGPPVRSIQYTLKLRPQDAGELQRGDTVEGAVHGDDLTFEVTSRAPTASAASDGCVLFDLKLNT